MKKHSTSHTLSHTLYKWDIIFLQRVEAFFIHNNLSAVNKLMSDFYLSAGNSSITMHQRVDKLRDKSDTFCHFSHCCAFDKNSQDFY